MVKSFSYFVLRSRSLALRFLLLLLLAAPAVTTAQRAVSISQAKTLYFEPFTGGPEADQLRNSLIRHLEKTSRFRIVQTPADADATVQGDGVIWVRGFVSTNTRTPAFDRRAVYSGYLSLEVVGAGGQPLWSWLATPGNLMWSDIIDDLAGRAAKKLLEAGKSAPAPSLAPASRGALAPTALVGAGATFPAPLYQKWFEDFEQFHPGVTIRYNAVGSELGVKTLAAGQSDFAGADLAPEVVVTPEAASHLRRVATVLGAVVPIYNLKGVTEDLHLTPEALADIYLGKVRRWNDPEIRQSNKDVDLPDAEIAVVHRADGSGTTWVWSDFLSRVSPAWSSSVGRGSILNWPLGVGAQHNEGVADTVKSTPDSIGYVELTYGIQHQLSFAAVRNKAGEFIHADLESVAAAARLSTSSGGLPELVTDAPGKDVYPIAAFTWIVIPSRIADPAKKAALTELLRWILTDGQRECSALGYAPLPRDISESELRMLSSQP